MENEAKLYEAKEAFEFRGVQRKIGDVFRIADNKVEALGTKVVLESDQSKEETPLETSETCDPEIPATPEAPDQAKVSDGGSEQAQVTPEAPQTPEGEGGGEIATPEAQVTPGTPITPNQAEATPPAA